MKSDKIDWVDLASEAGYLYRSPNIVGGMIYTPEGQKICDSVNRIIREEFEEEGFSLWSFSNRVARSDLEIVSSSKSDQGKGGFEDYVHWVSRNIDGQDTLPREALRPAGESQIYPFWAKNIDSYRQFQDLGRVMLQQRFFRVPPKGHRTTTRLESEVSEGHALFEDKFGADEAMLRYLMRCENIADILGMPYVTVESPVWDNNHFNDRSMYQCSILDGAVRLFGSAYNQGTNLSKKFGISYQDKSNNRTTPHIADWGIGAFYPALWHSRDENGFVLPFDITPYHIHIIQIGDDAEVADYVNSIRSCLSENGYSSRVDVSKRVGKHRKEWELKGYPVRIEIGKRELEKKALPLWHRWKSEERYSKTEISDELIVSYLDECRSDFKRYLHEKNQSIKDSSIIFSESARDLSDSVADGFVGMFHWCGDDRCIEKMYGLVNPETKEREGGLVAQGKFLGWNPRKKAEGSCVSCGNYAEKEGYWSRRKHI